MSADAEKAVKVLYDFTYSDDSGPVEIKTGDVYSLVEKTNDEWWQVYASSDPHKEPFFVPAQYVKIIPKKSARKSLKNSDKTSAFSDDSLESAIDYSGNSDDDDEEYSEASKLNTSDCGIQSRLSGEEDFSNDEDHTNGPHIASKPKPVGDYVNLDQYRDVAGIQKVPGLSEKELPPKKKPPQVPLELFQGIAPKPEDGKFVRNLSKDQPWDIYKENVSGRLYFVNRETGERLWKPPRKVTAGSDQTSLPSAASLANVKEEKPDIPAEYDQIQENGSTYFVHKVTQEKWKSLVDSVGRQYFHKVGCPDTHWSLPTLSGVPDTDNVPHNATETTVQIKPRLRQHDVNWESQEHRLSTFGGHPARATKAMSMYGGHLEATRSSPSSRVSSVLGNLPSSRLVPLVNDLSRSPPRATNSQRPTNLATSNSKGSSQPLTLEPVYFNTDVHEGYLYMTKVLDISKKKVKKSWTQIYVVLQGSNLVFYKDQKAAAQKQGSPFGKPEAVVSLQGAHLDINPKELTSKKNTILLHVSAGNVYLFQSENEKENFDWFTRMKIIANDVSPAEPIPHDSDVQEAKKEKGMIRSVSLDDNTALHNVDRTRNMVRIRAKLLNFISRRPTQEDLYKRGIIKDAVFGSRLHELCDREQENVPNFVRKCIAAVESKGITHDGLYRISGNMAEIQRLRCIVDTDDNYNLYDEQWDINVLTGALKMFFRELKEPVFTFRLYPKFVEAVKKESRKDKLSAFKSAVSDLPRCNHATLKVLFHHLRRVMEASHKNRMQSQNIGIVFGPTLLWQQDSAEGLAVQTMLQNRIVEFILLEYMELFH
ncbi:hypothetical protein BsWGS_05371 [Bradybaena similaris]